MVIKRTKEDARKELKRKKEEIKEKREQITEIEEKEEVYEDNEEENGNDHEYETSSLTTRSFIETPDDKEAELDARILRIQKMNDVIRKRREEIEHEKMLFG